MNEDQKKILRICTRLNREYGDDFVGWVNRYISFKGLKRQSLTDQQVEIANALIDSKNTCVSAGGGIGKTALAALLVIWFLATHPRAKVPTTAPTSKQLNDVLWSEVQTWLKRCYLQDLFVLRKGKLFVRGFDEWYSVARTIPKDGKNLNDTLAGFHAPYLMILADEASGISDPVFTALEGAMTQENSYIFLISNPVSTGGYFFDTINSPDDKGKDYKVLYYDSRDSPLVDESYEQRIINRYGKNSSMYQSKVLGRPISELGSVAVTPDTFDRVIRDQRNYFEGPVVMSVDVGGGGDPTVFCHKRGASVVRWDELSTTDPDDITDYAFSLYYRLWQGCPFSMVVDAAGIGWGPYHTISKRANFPVVGFIGQEKAHKSYMFRNRRTEAYYNLSIEFENLHFPGDPPERLKKELANIKFDYSAEPMELEDKKKLKSRLGFSTDNADALMMAVDTSVYGYLSVATKIPQGTARTMERLKVGSRSNKFGNYKKFVV